MNRPRFAMWSVISALIILLLVIGFYFDRRFATQYSEETLLFSADVEVVVWYPDFWWVTYRSMYGDTVSPVDALLILRIVNLQDGQSSIQKYSVEVQNQDGSWAHLRRITPLGSTFYNTREKGDLKTAREIDFSRNALDLLIFNRDLAAGATVRGWAFYEAPQNFKPVPSSPIQFRIIIRDSKNDEVTILSASKQNSLGDSLGGGWFRVTGVTRDISGFHRKRYSEPVR